MDLFSWITGALFLGVVGLGLYSLTHNNPKGSKWKKEVADAEKELQKKLEGANARKKEAQKHYETDSNDTVVKRFRSVFGKRRS